MNHFDQAAQEWDSNPIHWERSEAIADKIRKRIKLQPDMIAMEYGAGTAILSFLLKDELQEIVLMDSSAEMVRVMGEKIEKEKVSHLKPLFFDLETTDYNLQKFDLIYTQMVLHHVADVKNILLKFYNLLFENGKIAIADLYTEDGSFHGVNFGGHLGFDVDYLTKLMFDIGFKNILFEKCFVVKKQTTSGKEKEFPLFLLTAQK